MTLNPMNPQEKRSALVEPIRQNARYVLGIGDDELTNREAFESVASRASIK